MKKKLLMMALCLLTAGTAMADVEINERNFPDVDFRYWVLSQSYGQDGVLTDAEIAGVTSINVYYKSIQSLKGIEFFTALQYLDCSVNQLTSLDVSKNTALTYLRCNNNQLTSLDVSKNTALRELNCYRNQIKGAAMDALVQSLPTVSGSNSGVMDVIDNSYEGNVMTTTQVAAAKAKNWTPYYYDGPEWKEYAGSVPDVKIDETNFPDAKFRNWVLAQPYGKDGVLTGAEIAGVKDIDVKGKSIQSLKGIEFFTALQYLNCYSNQLTSLDVSGCTALTWLNCYSNQIKGAGMDALVQSLPTVSCSYGGTLSVIVYGYDGNVMTTTQVAAAKAKNWTPYYYDGSDWKEYAGSDASGIEAVAAGRKADQKSGRWYDMQGRQLTGQPAAGGVYIRDGRKVVVK